MSEVSSSGGLDEKEQISVPKDLFYDFESLKNVTNLTTVDLMRKLLGEYHNQPRLHMDVIMEWHLCVKKADWSEPDRLPDCAASNQDSVTTSHHRQESGIIGQDRISPPSGSSFTSIEMTPQTRIVTGKPLSQIGRKGRIPGQKLKQVCEILHCKRAAREMAEQRRMEASDRNCNSAGSSSSGTVTSMEEPALVNCDFQPVSLQPEAMVRPSDIHVTSKAPCAHNNNNPDAVNLRKLLGTRPMTSLADHGHSAYPKHMDLGDMVLDLSVPKPRDTQQSVAQSRFPMLSQESTALFDRRKENDSPVVHDSPMSMTTGVPPSGLDQCQVSEPAQMQNHSSPLFVYSSPSLCVSTEGSVQTTGHCYTASEQHVAQSLPSFIQPAVPSNAQVEGVASVSRNVLGLPRMRTRPRRQMPRKPLANEGMKLINENNLYPGVYTSTFKLPGSRRGRRSTAAKQSSQQQQEQAAKNNVIAPSTSNSGQSSMVIPVQVPNGAQQPYMMLCPQVAVSSVLVKSPRKRGRPPKRPTISQFQGPTEPQASTSQMVVPPSQMTIALPSTGNPGIVSSDNGAVSYLYQPQAEQTPVNFPHQTLQHHNQGVSAPATLHPNHSQLVSILNQATSINACNPVFVPNSSLQQGVPTALPTNAAGIITLPLQNIKTEPQPCVQGFTPNLVPSPRCVPSPQLMPQEISHEESKLSPAPETPSTDASTPTTTEPLKTTDVPPAPGVFHEMILSPQALVNVKPRSKPTTTELIRSNSNFYCGSFKIRPQKPNTQTGQSGAPLKRGRGRPRLNVFESSRQKETKESRSKMYQELFHCKVCNEIVWAGERLSHQRKHVSVKCVCTSCGIEFHTYKNSTIQTKKIHSQQCPQCKKLYSYDMNPTEDCTTDNVDGGVCETTGESFASQNDAADLEAANDELACQICGKLCGSPVSYAQHINEHQYDSLTCVEDGCCRRFRNSSELRRHIKHTHTKGKEHQCVYEGCDKKFMKNFHLQEHIRVKHFNIKAFKCPWPGCEKEFAGIRHLKVHMLIHKGEKPLKCDFCDYRCRQRNALNWHMRKHPEVSSQYTDGRPASDSDPDGECMVIDMNLHGADSAGSEDLSPKGYEPENEEESSPESFSDFSPVADQNSPDRSHALVVDDE